jgi:hypothetical protein
MEVTHLGRVNGARNAEANGGKEADLRKCGRWQNGPMNGHYLNTLPRKAMRALGGYSVKHGNYWLEREQFQPPIELAKLIFPELEHCESQLNMSRTQSNSDTDLAAFGFLRLLKFLRTVLLQDSVDLIRLYPNNVIFKHSIFHTQGFKTFCTAHLVSTSTIEDPTSLSLKLAMPHMTEVSFILYTLFTVNQMQKIFQIPVY